VEFRHEVVIAVERKRPEYVRVCHVPCSVFGWYPSAKLSRYLVHARDPVVDYPQCDQIPLPDGCSQCATAKRNCPGYRTPGELAELAFRDESSSVVRKFKAKGAKANQMSKRHPMPVSIPREDSDFGSQQSLETVQQRQQRRQQQQQQHPSLGITLMPTIDERATGFFITNYVLSAHGPTRGHRKRIPRPFLINSNSLIIIRHYKILEIDLAVSLRENLILGLWFMLCN
jgi:hypothetical protein